MSIMGAIGLSLGIVIAGKIARGDGRDLVKTNTFFDRLVTFIFVLGLPFFIQAYTNGAVELTEIIRVLIKGKGISV